jgi:hypothetical protein
VIKTWKQSNNPDFERKKNRNAHDRAFRELVKRANVA